MPAYHQMGHDSENLVDEPELSAFTGAVLSPVNYTEAEVAAQIDAWGERSSFETIFDPQLYNPRSTRGCLRNWSYFPRDFDTADQSSDAWWGRLIQDLARTCSSIHPSCVCSPALVPGIFNDDFYSHQVSVCTELCRNLEGTGTGVLQTAIVNLPELSEPGRALAIASILSGTDTNRLYVVFWNNTAPRRELRNTQELKGAMRLISALEETGLSVLVGFCSSDVILWKAAGASSCASGKFFNLRRFTPSRWDEDQASGGGQVAYWFEEALFAFLRQSDVIRTAQRSMLSERSLQNPYGRRILNQLEASPAEAWLGLGWRQFMYWFADIEARIGSDQNADAVLVEAENNWLVEPRLLLDEPQNNGEWVRPWRIALQEFRGH